jgi:hypothetical protein
VPYTIAWQPARKINAITASFLMNIETPLKILSFDITGASGFIAGIRVDGWVKPIFQQHVTCPGNFEPLEA